jgi:lipopolysaccharide/colanic/teichoic acid biosynthesis glycosyltransferase
MTAVTAEVPEAIDVDPLKALFDRVFAALGLIVTAPFLALGALAIFLDGLFHPANRGPVFHHETRISGGEPFTIIKFRTMQVSAIEEMRDKGLTVKYLEREGRGQTGVGLFLRRYYLDELPQLINIWRGDMSFVGPRPSAPFEYERELKRGNVRKRLAKAGLVGLQQAHKGRAKSFDEEVALDYEYVRCAGSMKPLRRLAYDLSIMMRSIRVLLEGKGLNY